MANQTGRYMIFFVLGIFLAGAVFYIGWGIPGVEETPTGLVSDQQDQEVSLEAESIIEKIMPIVAVDSLQNEGRMGELRLRILPGDLIPGDTNILIDTNPFLQTDIQYSANIAVTVARMITENYTTENDFIFTYDIESDVVGGGSAGAATTIATIAALEGREINNEVAMTGTINPDGTIGQVGGILEKARAVADAGYRTFLIPDGQSRIRYYERVTEEVPSRRYRLYNTYYVPRVIDIQQEIREEWGLEVIEVSDIEEAMEYMLA